MTEAGISRARAWGIALVATGTMVVSYVDRQTLAVLAPTVTAALHISDADYGWLASAFSLAYLVGAPLAGRWIDRVGARRGLVLAVLTWSAVAALHTLVPGFAVLFALRIALGSAEAPSFPGAAQVVHRVLPPSERARGLGVLFTGSSVGGMIAPPLAVFLMRHLGWRMAFVGTAVAGLAWVPAWLAVTRGPAARRVLDAPPEAHPLPSNDPSLSVTVPYRAVLHPPDPGSLLAVATHPAVLRAMALVIATAPSIAFVLLWGAKYLVRQYHLTQDDVAWYLWLPPLFFDLGAVASGDLAARRARRLHGAPDLLLVAVAGALMLTVSAMPFASTAWGTIALASVAMTGGGAVFGLLTADMLARVHPARVSAAGGVTAAAQSLAYVVANPLIGRGVQHWGDYTWVLLALGLWVLPGLSLWLGWKPPAPYARTEALGG